MTLEEAKVMEAQLDRIQELENYAVILSDLVEGMLQAAGEDDPRIAEMPHVIAGRAKIAEVRKYLGDRRFGYET
jgi:hypothetical protein